MVNTTQKETERELANLLNETENEQVEISLEIENGLIELEHGIDRIAKGLVQFYQKSKELRNSQDIGEGVKYEIKEYFRITLNSIAEYMPKLDVPEKPKGLRFIIEY